MSSEIISKVIPAYESSSSTTTRITPKAIGELLAKVPPNDLHRCLDSFVGYKNMYATKEVIESAVADLTTAIGDLKTEETTI